ncbi:hypothetical protein BASA83_013503 [Batrachochytrium salamandrivorans]|nr:hypothetical protein BASA83_013503 [Batrachochytrium salamandrivorans]
MKSARQDQLQTSELKLKQSHEEKEWIRPRHTRLFLQGRRHGKAKTPRTVEARVQMERPISRCRCRSSGNLLVDDSPGTPIPKMQSISLIWNLGWHL